MEIEPISTTFYFHCFVPTEICWRLFIGMNRVQESAISRFLAQISNAIRFDHAHFSRHILVFSNYAPPT